MKKQMQEVASAVDAVAIQPGTPVSQAPAKALLRKPVNTDHGLLHVTAFDQTFVQVGIV